ncbi:MAG: hypothetical protein KDJ69_05990 [Nitratireductor sp.]|nr:hypothetical protein [Nitratireductor sp.]
MKTLKAITIAAITVIAAGTSTANAGGLFGGGGLIGGSVGKALGRHVGTNCFPKLDKRLIVPLIYRSGSKEIPISNPVIRNPLEIVIADYE